MAERLRRAQCLSRSGVTPSESAGAVEHARRQPEGMGARADDRVVALEPFAVEEGEGLRPGGHRFLDPSNRKWGRAERSHATRRPSRRRRSAPYWPPPAAISAACSNGWIFRSPLPSPLAPPRLIQKFNPLSSAASSGTAGRRVSANTFRGCSSTAKMCIRRLTYDNRSHPVLRLCRFIGSCRERQAFTGPAQRYPGL